MEVFGVAWLLLQFGVVAIRSTHDLELSGPVEMVLLVCLPVLL